MNNYNFLGQVVYQVFNNIKMKDIEESDLDNKFFKEVVLYQAMKDALKMNDAFIKNYNDNHSFRSKVHHICGIRKDDSDEKLNNSFFMFVRQVKDYLWNNHKEKIDLWMANNDMCHVEIAASYLVKDALMECIVENYDLSERKDEIIKSLISEIKKKLSHKN